jgi:glutathione S-transferase
MKREAVMPLFFNPTITFFQISWSRFMLVLYDLAISSYGCKTRILLRHKGLEWTSLAPPNGYGSPAYCKIVPSGTIPALVHDGFTLGESDAIAEYVNELAPEPAMLPEAIKERAMARALSRFHDTRIEPLLRAYFGQVTPANRNVDFIAKNAALLERRFHQLAEIRTPSPLLTGTELSLADCGFAPSFAILDCLQGLLGFDLTLPASIKAYQAALCAQPSVRDEYAAYVKALDEWAAAKMAG